MKSKIQRGIGLIEIVVVAAFLGVMIVGAGGLIGFGNRLLEAAQNRHEAQLYAQEAVEALKSLRNQSWSANIAPLTPGTIYFLEASGTPLRWQMVTSDPGPLYGRPQNFRREILLGRVFRDGSGNIVGAATDTLDDDDDSGTEDSNTRLVLVTISWQDRTGRTHNLTARTYLVNLRNN